MQTRTRDALSLEHSYGVTLWNVGRYDEACAHFRRAIALVPTHTGSRVGLWRALWDGGFRDDFDAEMEALRKMCDDDPDDILAEARRSKGVIVIEFREAWLGLWRTGVDVLFFLAILFICLPA